MLDHATVVRWLQGLSDELYDARKEIARLIAQRAPANAVSTQVETRKSGKARLKFPK